ncbi:MAG TPA: hypothetical protein DEQ84_02965 [Prevotellaceae bacterium]|nr:hypothetical protein [Prevotellaceae bacterium]
MKKFLLILSFILLLPAAIFGQGFDDDNRFRRIGQGSNQNDRNRQGNTDENDTDGERSNIFGRHSDSSKKKDKTPTGLRVWEADPRFGTIDSVQIDTFSHSFQNANFTEGIHGQYNTLGNLGSPRLSRLFANRPLDFSYFIFSEPYDFFITPFSKIHFTNTKSPITNISYHESMGSDNGEDRIRALYAINMGKDIGFGLKLDYLYGRGYYDHQSTSNFNATLFGSILKDQYKAHFAFYANYLKTGENGGIESDDYVTNPENFPSKFGTNDIPTRLDKVWNKMHVNGLQWTHRYSMGFHKVIEKTDSTKSTAGSPSTTIPTDSAKATGSANATTKPASADTAKIAPPKTLFIPVTSFIHTLKIEDNTRKFIANEPLDDFYTNKYFEGDSTADVIKNTLVSNLLAIELHEGFNKWAMAGIRLYAQHDFNSFKLPAAYRLSQSYNENRITLGGQLFKEKGRNINYTLQAETSSDGSTWGDFKLSGYGLLKTRFLGDSIRLRLHGSIIGRQPTFFYRTYHSHHLWWDNSLDKQFTTRIGAILKSEKTRTRLSFDLQNIEKYTYFATTAQQATNGTSTYYTYDTEVRQSSTNLQLIGVTLNQDFTLGILNWENEIAYQTSTNQNILPVPALSLYSNLYLLFRIAKVLRVELGGDVRFFTPYYAPTYSPAIGMYATQAENERIKIGNYPIIDVYANLHLKHTRFYFMASHVNYSKNGSGNQFLVPHYPINPFVIRLGLSWNFFN